MLSRKFVLMLLICVSLLISACQKKDQIQMIVPYGSTHISQVHLMDNDIYQRDLVLGPDPLIAAFGSEDYDVIFAPLILGVKMYQSKPNYKLLATIIESTFYLVTCNDRVSELEDIKHQEIIIFGKGQTGDIITSYVLESLDIEVSKTYVDSLSDAAISFIRNEEKIVLVSEPIYAKLALLYDDIKTIDIMSYYRTISGIDTVPQAGVFVHERLSHEQVKKLFNDLNDAVDLLYDDIDLSLRNIKKDDPNMDESIFIKSLESNYISLYEANINKSNIEKYLENILLFNPNIIGGSIPPDTFYWK
ncbi:MAG: hypothetical protein CVV61_01110 [Tenericutes bacterium HGW-Tenericutes-6]|jgi:hypothetical protein|nr:MAG: hypothetical protein CVV61_01110 [Tenericutes bacterium HGW-Tenericutes-6]